MGSTSAGAAIELGTPLTNNLDPDFEPHRIVIGGSFKDSASITVPEDGLRGHIIINQPNGAGEWTSGAVVHVGSVDLDGPEYDALPEEIGGGAAGLAPFTLHRRACEPRHDTMTILHVTPTCNLEGDPSCLDLLECVTSINEFRLVFRGPLVTQTPETAEGVLVIKKRSLVAPVTPWEDILVDIAEEFEAVFETGTDGIQSSIRVYRTDQADLGRQVEYQVTRGVVSPPRCFGVGVGAGTPPPVQSFTYQFTLYFDCRLGLVDLYDLNGDGVVDYVDLLNWLILNQDLNFDGNINAIDFEVLYAAILYYENLE